MYDLGGRLWIFLVDFIKSKIPNLGVFSCRSIHFGYGQRLKGCVWGKCWPKLASVAGKCNLLQKCFSILNMDKYWHQSMPRIYNFHQLNFPNVFTWLIMVAGNEIYHTGLHTQVLLIRSYK